MCHLMSSRNVLYSLAIQHEIVIVPTWEKFSIYCDSLSIELSSYYEPRRLNRLLVCKAYTNLKNKETKNFVPERFQAIMTVACTPRPNWKWIGMFVCVLSIDSSMLWNEVLTHACFQPYSILILFRFVEFKQLSKVITRFQQSHDDLFHFNNNIKSLHV